MSQTLSTRSGNSFPLSGVHLARVPVSGLAALAVLRGREEITVHVEGDWAWVSWQPTEDGQRDEVVEALLPVPGSAFFRKDEGHWYRAGRRLPELIAVPSAEAKAGATGIALHRALVPEPTRWLEPRAEDWRPAVLRLEADSSSTPRPASALLILVNALLPWAESVPTALLQGLRAARSGDRVLLVGRRLPPMAGLGRFWGRQVLVPMGFRPEPELPGPRMAEALGLVGDDLGLIGLDGRVEVVPGAALGPLSRASARLLAGVSDRLLAGTGRTGRGR